MKTFLAPSKSFSTLISVSVSFVACYLAAVAVGSRSLLTGSDTEAYARFFLSLKYGMEATRLEPGFVLLTYGLSRSGLEVSGYFTALFVLLLGTAWWASRQYYAYIRASHDGLAYWCCVLALLFLSPIFLDTSINIIRHGFASLFVFGAMLAAQEKRWYLFVALAAVALGFHYSSVLYLAIFPLVFLEERKLLVIVGLGAVAYASGLTRLVVWAISPQAYSFVQDYGANAEYSGGIRLDFAVFSAACYVLLRVATSTMVSSSLSRARKASAVYLVLLLPFFVLGWGNFSNRYLVPAWMSLPLFGAACLTRSNLRPLRNQILIWAGLAAATVHFCLALDPDL